MQDRREPDDAERESIIAMNGAALPTRLARSRRI
jgi:hypothetical protein